MVRAMALPAWTAVWRIAPTTPAWEGGAAVIAPTLVVLVGDGGMGEWGMGDGGWVG